MSRAELTGILRDCDVAGIDEVFVVGGDRKNPAGPYESALPLLEDIAQYTGGVMRAGVAGYPEGHPSVAAVDLVDALAGQAAPGHPRCHADVLLRAENP